MATQSYARAYAERFGSGGLRVGDFYRCQGHQRVVGPRSFVDLANPPRACPIDLICHSVWRWASEWASSDLTRQPSSEQRRLRSRQQVRVTSPRLSG